MDDNIGRKHSYLCYQMKRLILFSGMIMLFTLLTACGRQESEKAEEKSETQEISDAGDNPDKQEEQEESKPLKQVYIGDTRVLCGVYRAEEGEYAPVIGPELCLYPNGEGSFHVHSASSYIASGRLIFLADESAEVWNYSSQPS